MDRGNPLAKHFFFKETKQFIFDFGVVAGKSRFSTGSLHVFVGSYVIAL